MKATVTYYDPIHDEATIKVGEHKLHYGGSPSGYCYNHGDWDCVLTEDEEVAVQKAEWPATEEY